MFHLTAEEEQRLTEADVLTKVSPKKKPRQHTGLVVAAVNYFHKQGHETVQSSGVVAALAALGKWPADKSNRAIGDILGGHGLKLQRLRGKKKGGMLFAIPEGGITDEYLESVGIDVESLGSNEAVPVYDDED